MRSAADSPWRLPARHPRTPGSISNRPFYEGIKVTYLGLKDLLTLVGDNGVTVPVRMRETGPDTHVYSATVIAVDGSAGQADALNSNLDPIKTGDGDRPHIAVNHGGAVVISYSDQSPVGTLSGRVEVEVEPPIFSQTSPASGDTVNSLDKVLTAEVVDTISGVNPATGGTKKSVDLIIFDSNQVEVDTASGDITVTDLGGGAFRIEYNINKIPVIAAAKTAKTEIVTNITWRVETLEPVSKGAKHAFACYEAKAPNIVKLEV